MPCDRYRHPVRYYAPVGYDPEPESGNDDSSERVTTRRICEAGRNESEFADPQQKVGRLILSPRQQRQIVRNSRFVTADASRPASAW